MAKKASKKDSKSKNTKPNDGTPVSKNASKNNGSAVSAVARDVRPSPVVGIGASAGGLSAFTQLLKALPTNTGMGFVIVQHLSAMQSSKLTDILSHATKMPVAEIKDGLKIKPNHIYVIPPNREVTVNDGILKLTNRPKGLHLPIDKFFCSLAQDYGDMALGVVLSGTATDGTLGLEAIQQAGGITFAQDETAEYSGMPRSAANSGHANFILPPKEIAREIARISRHPYARNVPISRATDEKNINDIINLIYDAKNVDFSNYKISTLQRRISRRMALFKIESLHEYYEFIQQTPTEIDAIFQDILINVTSFFRNNKAFEALKKSIFPKLLKDRKSDEPVRIWVVACSTGEEAYSIAIAFLEAMDSKKIQVPLQIFASDLNSAAIKKARSGIYSKAAVADVSPERLRRFFSEADGSYRISKTIRDMCVFSQHNITSDPFFSRMDLISCRNLLIYLEPVLQKQILPYFHYALKADGFLWLGSSETIGSFRNLFKAEDSKYKFFTKIFTGSVPTKHIPKLGKRSQIDLTFPAAAPYERGPDLNRHADQVLLTRYAPPSVLVSDDMEILQFRGDTSAYLMPAAGKASLNLLKMLRDGLVVDVRAAISRARKEKVSIREKGLRIKLGAQYQKINLEIVPVKKGTEKGSGFLILFEEATSPAAQNDLKANILKTPLKTAAKSRGTTTDIRKLTQELLDTREYLQSIIDQQEIVNDELQTAHEELQSTNEELQSINEELETSKEEIEASNEELTTVNDELHHRNQELNRINNDMTNLLASVEMPIVMLDEKLQITRFTPLAAKVFNLISADIGRPFDNIKLNFDLPDLIQLMHEILSEDCIKEVEVLDRHRRWYSLRMRPYKTSEGKTEGIVLMLLDIDTIKKADEYTESILATVQEPLLVLDADFKIRSSSPSFSALFQLAHEEIDGKSFFEIANEEWNIPSLRSFLEEVLPGETSFDDLEVTKKFEGVGTKTLLFTGRRLIQPGDRTPAILLAIKDISERKRLDDVLRDRAEGLALADRYKNQFLAMLAHELRNPLAPLTNAMQILGRPEASPAMVAETCEMMGHQLQHMVRLVDDLMDIGRITFGKIELREDYFILSDAFKNAIETVKPLLDTRQHTLKVHLPQEPLWLYGDLARISQILSNLLNNAAKYTNPNGHIILTARQEGEEIVIVVQDNGNGIPPTMLKKIFDIFAQVDDSFERRQGGLGLGLNLVRTLVDMHGGSIEAHSAGPGTGSTFTVRLPAAKPQETPIPVEHPSKLKLAASHHILVVDDNEASAKTMGLTMELMVHVVRLAFDGKSAIETAKAFMPDIVLLDIGLPNMNGYEVCRAIRDEPLLKDTILIAQTGWGQSEDRQRAMEAGFDFHLVKPINIVELEKILHKHTRHMERN